MFTDGLTNKLVGGWREGAKQDTVLVRSASTFQILYLVFLNGVFGISRRCIWYFWVGLFSNIVLTNTFCCRVYGDKTEQYIDRGAEVKLFHILCLWWKIHNNF